MTALADVAKKAGIAIHWQHASGEARTVSDDVQRAILAKLGLPADSQAAIRESYEQLRQSQGSAALTVLKPGGRYPVRGKKVRFRSEDGVVLEAKTTDGEVRAPFKAGYYALEDTGETLAVVPGRAHGLERKRLWAVATQLYALHGNDHVPFGDFAALADFAAEAARHGASAVAISPVHALFGGAPEQISPYAPSSRLFLNPLFAPAPARSGGKAAPLIDWESAAKAKTAALYRVFTTMGEDRAFDAFVRSGGVRLLNHARFEVLDRLYRQKGIYGWRNWRPEHRNSKSRAVTGLTRQDAAVRFQLFLQWQAAKGLQSAQAAAQGAGMQVGLITDMAVGMDPSGSHAWSVPDEVLEGLSIGAPPDIYNPGGQNWGLTGFSPQGLLRGSYAGFIGTLRAAMLHAGGIRLDHAMGLQRLWVVPDGATPAEGAYLHYPFADMLGLLVLESRRNNAIVVAEDLGTVPAGFRERIARAGLLGMRVLWFERDAKDRFLPPEDWDPNAAALSTTHDLPTLAGWWTGHDLVWRQRLGATPAATKEARAARAKDRGQLWSTLKKARCAKGGQPSPRAPTKFADAAIAALTQTPCPLVLIPVEDFVDEVEQPNIPGTTNEHPNWRRRLKSKRPLAGASAARRIAILKAERP